MFEPGLTVTDAKKRLAREALEHFHGNRTHTARAIGISIRTLRNWINAWGLHYVGRNIVVPRDTRVICPECWAPIAEVGSPLYQGQMLTFGAFVWKWKPPVIEGDMMPRCWWPGCKGVPFKDGRIFTKQGWVP